ncbi:MAG: 50S ribosomal protein L4 [Limnochordia bacterium]|jgi:large subunit ribosomal protein L4|nr:50S ribosomal protein L4 [Limnochordia bacterium]MDD2629758.1 50S ribosomal protein L4 [Limnochordia bacterium]
MPQVTVLNADGKQVETMELRPEVFGAKINESLMHDAVVAHLARCRQGTVATKTRAEVRGGGRKPWRQKGTGRARHGSIRSPIWVGGGVTFGPQPRDFGYSMPKKARRNALKSALSAKLEAGQLIVVDDLGINEPRTKLGMQLLDKLGIKDGSVLIVTAENDKNVLLATRNIPKVNCIVASDVHVYPLLVAKHVIMTSAAIKKVEEVLG